MLNGPGVRDGAPRSAGPISGDSSGALRMEAGIAIAPDVGPLSPPQKQPEMRPTYAAGRLSCVSVMVGSPVRLSAASSSFMDPKRLEASFSRHL